MGEARDVEFSAGLGMDGLAFREGEASPGCENHLSLAAHDVHLDRGLALVPPGLVRERIERLKGLSKEFDRDLPALQFGLRITTLVRDTTEEAWADAEAKVAEMAKKSDRRDQRRFVATGQQRLLALHEQGDVLDDNLYTAPGKYGGGGAGTTWLVGSAEDVARSLRKYQDLGISCFVLSDTPYLAEIKRQGDQLLPLLQREPALA